MNTGWQDISYKRYYFEKSGKNAGAMLTGWQTIGNNTYYLQVGGGTGERGKLYTGWRMMNNKVYYFQKGTPMEISAECIRAGGRSTTRSIISRWGRRRRRGKMYTGWHTLGKNTHYFQMGGENGEKGQNVYGLADDE